MQANYEVADFKFQRQGEETVIFTFTYIQHSAKFLFALWLFLHTWPHTPQAFLETSYQAGHLLLERKTRPQHRELHALLYRNNVWAHSYLLTRAVRRDLRFIVLIREDLKV